MPTIISIANEKGGVAKTTTTVSLGAAIVETGLEVLVIDLDGQANLSLALGNEGSKSKSSVANVLLENLPAQNAVQETGIPRLFLLPATSELTLAERFLTIRQGYETTLAKAIQAANWSYDYIIIDCPPFLGAVTLNALIASDLLLKPAVLTLQAGLWFL